MRSFPGNFDASPETGRVTSTPRESQPVDTTRFCKLFGKNLEDFGSASSRQLSAASPMAFHSIGGGEDDDEKVAL
jgi:hypothetical protein